MSTVFKAAARDPKNKLGLRRLRKEGRLPGIVFGAGQESAMFHISLSEFERWLRTGQSGIIHLDLEGRGKIPVLLQDVQRHPVSRDILHVDFLQVRQDTAVRTAITLEYVGTARGAKVGGIVQTQAYSVEVEALPADLPSVITVDISDLDVGESLHAGDIQLPDNVALASSEDELLISIVVPRGAGAGASEEEEEAAQETESA